jgi:nucleotide-binding universal stress UspA family protein
MAFQKILIAVDESPLGAHAADQGVVLARSLGAEIAFVNVVAPLPGVDGVPPTALREEGERAAHGLLEAAASRASAPALRFVRYGHAAREIIAAAEDWGADAIVLGTHGRSALTRALLGSVAEGVLSQSRRPVVLIPRPS